MDNMLSYAIIVFIDKLIKVIIAKVKST